MSHERETRSPWMGASGAPPRQRFDRDMTADVGIVGAGIAGLTTAYLLLKDGRSVVVIDGSTIGGGQTQRTTAHLSNAIDDRYFTIERLHGAEGAAVAAESHSNAIHQIARIVNEEGIDCDFEYLDGYLFLGPDHDRDYLEREYVAAGRAGLRGLQLLDQSPWPALTNGPCLRFPRQAQLHPVRYLNGLAQAVVRLGGEIFTNSHVRRLDGGVPGRIETDRGRVLTCDSVVVATNTPVNDLVTMHTKQAAYRTYALAARISRERTPPALFWDTAEPYHYLRRHDVIGANGRPHAYLIVGGEDHKTGQPPPGQDSERRLEEWARKHCPGLGPVERAWSGQVMETTDGLAFIGRNPHDEPNVFIATGDSGMGMTHGTIAGMILSELIGGREHPWAAVYDPSRKTLRAFGHFTRENLNTAWQYTDWVTGGDVGDPDEIRPGRGAVVRSGLHKLAVYRDSKGSLHTCSATCPHLGGIVHWNDVEKSWDCPCHGSRFDRFGQFLCGPTISNLTRIRNEQNEPATKSAAM